MVMFSGTFLHDRAAAPAERASDDDVRGEFGGLTRASALAERASAEDVRGEFDGQGGDV